MIKLNQEKLDTIVRATTSSKLIHGAAFRIEAMDHGFALTSAAGNIEPNGLFYIASINKLFLSAVTLRLCLEGKISLADKIEQYLPAETMRQLHVFRGVDYSSDITISHLLTQTSGLPCYLIDKRPGNSKLMEELLHGQDQEWPFEKVIVQVKQMKAKFKPGQKGKASYGNTNFRLLGRILEVVMEDTLDVILANLFQELKLHHSTVFHLEHKKEFVPIYATTKEVNIPKYLASSKYDIISNTEDLMIFLKAFFNGYFYSKDRLPELEQWNDIFFPFQYGVGIQKFYTPRIFSPFKRIPHMVGHCGSVGTAAFFVPEKEIFITGTVNQTKSPSTLFKTIIKILNHL